MGEDIKAEVEVTWWAGVLQEVHGEFLMNGKPLLKDADSEAVFPDEA